MDVKCDLTFGDSFILKRIYVYFAALKKGFKEGCIPLIGTDGCYMKDIHPGQLLDAVGVVGNNQMFPIA